MNVVGIIPARYASTRLPGKPLLLIHGKSMIQRVYEQAKKSKLVNRIIVATDDKRIFNCVKEFGGEVMMTSRKHQSGTDRLAEAAKKIKCDIVVNIQGDEPFIDPKNIDKAIQPFIKDKNLNVSTLAFKIESSNDLSDMNKVKVVMDKNNYALYFSRSIIPYYMNPENVKVKNRKFYKHIGLYVYRKNFLLKFSELKKSYLEETEKLEQLRILENGEKIKIVLTKKDSISIDTIADIDKILSGNENPVAGKINLVEITERHRDSTVKLLNNENVEKWLLQIPSPYTYEDADEWINRCKNKEEGIYPFAIEYNGVHVGGIGLHKKSEHSAEVGYWIGEEFWGKGFATIALKKILDIAFNELKFHRVHAHVFEDNIVSEKLLLKCGFEYEGFLKKIHKKRDRFINSKLFAKVI